MSQTDDAVEASRLQVWSWSGRDQDSNEDLELAVAVRARRDLHGHVLRLQLPKCKQPLRVKNGEVNDLCVEQPGRVWWRTLGQSTHADWQPENELQGLLQDRLTRGE